MIPHLAALLLASVAQPDELQLPAPVDEAEFQRVLDSADRHLSRIETAVNGLTPRATEIASVLRDIEERRGGSFSSDNSRQILNRFPALAATGFRKGQYAFQGILTDPAKLQERFRAVSGHLAAARLCIEELRRGSAPLRAHCQYLLRCPNDIGVDEEGLFRYLVDQGYSLTKDRITAGRDIYIRDSSSGTSAAARDFDAELGAAAFDQCRLVVLENPDLQPESPVVRWRHLPRFGFSTLSEFKTRCSSEPSTDPTYKTLEQLAQRFPKSEDLADALRSPARICEGEAATRCSAVTTDGDVPAIAFVSVCSIERATLPEIKERLRLATRTADFTLLAETLDACVSAKGAGFSWEFREPRVPHKCLTAEQPTQSSQLQALLPTAPPPVVRGSPDKPVPASTLNRHTKRATWEKTGWNQFRWGMGPADVRERLQDKTGSFQLFTPPECVYSPIENWSFEYSCNVSSRDHVFRIGEMAPSLDFSFIDGRLWSATLFFWPGSYEETLSAFDSFENLLTMEFGKPDSSSHLPARDPSKDAWVGWIDWKSPSAQIKLMSLASKQRPGLSVEYRSVERAELFNKRARAAQEGSPKITHRSKAKSPTRPP